MQELQTAALEQMREMLAIELQERKVNPLFVPIVNKYLEGEDMDQIANEFGLQVMEVSLILERPEIKHYCNQVISSVGYLNKMKRVRLINKVIDKAVEEAEEYDAPYSRKDILDWIKVLQEESKLASASVPKTAIQVNQRGESNMVNLMNELLEE